MFRRSHVAAVALALGALACSKEDAGTHPSFQGTIAGAGFVPAEATAFVIEPTLCTNPEFAGWTITMVQVQFWSHAGACQDYIDTGFCGVKAGSEAASIALFRANVFGGEVPPIVPGTYTDEGTHVADANGVVNFLWLSLGSWDATCTPPASGMPKEHTAGSLTLDEVSATRVRGRAELAFDNGDVLSGTFDAPACPSDDAVQCAAMKGGCALPTCLP